MTPHDWNAPDYDATNAGVIALGLEVLDRLKLAGDEAVLDAGAGTGAISAVLAQRLPRGRAIALDASESMVAAARKRFADTPNVEVVHGDLNALDLGEQKLDAVLSTATFHWVKDHDRLWRNLHRTLRPGGQLVAQCGGAGNIESVRSAYLEVASRDQFREHVGGWEPTYFATAEDADASLRAAGFTDIEAWLEPRPVYPDDLSKHLREVILGAHKERLPAELFEPFAAAVEQQTGSNPMVDYVRLNISATA